LRPATFTAVNPAQAGIHFSFRDGTETSILIPAFAGMTALFLDTDKPTSR
jgi:hypothetical protein